MIENLNLKSTTQFISIKDIEKEESKTIKVRGFVQNINVTKKFIFIILREKTSTVQLFCMKSKIAEEKYSEIEKLSSESYIEATGTVNKVKDEIKSCSVKNVEVFVLGLEVLSKAEALLPFTYKSVAATLSEREELEGLASVAYNLCLDNRSLYLRTPQAYSFARVIDGIMFGFRDILRRNNFIEIKSPKLIECASEGGANVFSVDYFKRKAYLAQSPQLYKQMAIIGGLRRVYEIGHVYRAEESNINRYLSEFVGLDLEMEIETDYEGTIKFIYSVLSHIFGVLENEYGEELNTIKKYYAFEDFKYTKDALILTHRECIDLLKSEGTEIGYEDDFNNECEKKLGKLIKEKYNTDIFVVKDYPVSCRPFYTFVDPKTNLTRSYDFIIRGEEILSGAQRINNYSDLLANVKKYNIDPKTLGGYLEAFKCGAPPHGGCGIGLERLTKAYFGMSDIRHFSLFPRDPNRLYP
ncbi:putative aspartate--tRNA ligase, cytoplasmic [Nosema granulosis]|uniref:Probable aspartate--tRNA ligase, cytoplasmic n=1 Tax=Nosema granulosis TaxID=83296 RepID=A0A9P6H0H2_9MICR|nr:putative aspartate--tRNA ligase, cytoplasmic [Nosema granulosis]